MKYQSIKTFGLFALSLSISISTTHATEKTQRLLVDDQSFDPSKDSIMGYSSKGRETFQFTTTDGQVVEAVNINGLAYKGDMILGKTEMLKKNGLHFVKKGENRHASKGNIRRESESGVIHYAGKVWPNGIIYYHLSAPAGTNARANYEYAINHWNSNTGLSFVPRTNQYDYLNLSTGTGCSSWIGKQGGQQLVTLAEGCSAGAAVHELGHAAGLHHEQQRLDRDSYITILWNNIDSGMAYNFDKFSSSEGRNFGDYDYYSVMHYFATAFGSGKITMQPTDSSVNLSVMGYASGLSPTDIAAIQDLYFGSSGSNQPPVANFSSSVSNLMVSFTDTSTDDDNVTSRSWNFGNGQTSSQTNPTHTYASAGTYSVTLTVNDSQGLSNSKTQSVTVTSGGGSGGSPALTNPANGSTLSGSSQTFTWNAGNATSFWFYAGSTSGSSNYVSSGSLNGTTYTMSGLPTDGSTVYVKFWYNDGSWKSVNYTYTAANNSTGGGSTGGTGSESGNLSSSNTADYMTHGSNQYFDTNGGTITVNMTGASSTDFELALERKSGSSWTSVATSTQPTSTESITYSASAGQYRIKAHRYSGTGSYTVSWSYP